MTTGSINDDFRQVQSFPGSICWSPYTLLLGRRHTRDWSGGDYPSSNPKPRTTPYSPPFIMRGVKVPISYAYRERYVANGYRRLPKRAYIEDHNYSVVDFDYTVGLASYDRANDCDGSHPPPAKFFMRFENAFGGISHAFSWSSNDDLALLSKLREKVQGAGWNAGVMAAEAGQGLQLLAGAARDINRAYGQCRKGNVVGAWRSLTGLGKIPPHVARRLISENAHDAKVVARNWLALQYGWKPLLQDVHDAAAVLGHLLNTPLQRTIRASKKVKGSMRTQVPYLEIRDPVCFTRVSILARIRESSVPQLLGLTSPWDIVWEKTPFSFVADWFVPIGEWLSARGLASSLEATYVTSKKHHAECHQVVGTNPEDFNLPGLEITDLDYRWVGFTRTVSNDLLVPLPALKPLGKWASWQHAANAVALLITNFGSSGRGNTGISPNGR